jgi:hypothetical protein
MRLNPHLAEETELQSHADDQRESDFGCDWSSDPMEILMQKQEQELERQKLALWANYTVQ